jgi:PRC-barrel domain
MALRIEDASSLPGRMVVDQEGEEVGEITEVYGLGDEGEPMWVVVKTHTGGLLGDDVPKFVPLARIREDEGNLSVPYSSDRIKDAPEVDLEDELSEEDDQKLRIYYAIDLADAEFRDEPRSYAAQVPEGEGPARKITDELDSDSSGDGKGEGKGEGDGKGKGETAGEGKGSGETKGEASDDTQGSDEGGESDQAEKESRSDES